MSTMTKDKTLHFKNQWILYKAYKNDSLTLTFFILNRKAQYIPAKRKNENRKILCNFIRKG